MIEIKQDWGVFISQTGTEVISIARELGFLPSIVITNNLDKISKDNLEILKQNKVDIKIIPFRPTLEDYCSHLILEKKLLTLHGYLRIIPKEFFNVFKGKIYNGHPALITEYPELKGLNKQEDIYYYKEKYPFCGSVIHEVIPELDSGPVVAQARVQNISRSLDHAYKILRQTSLASWKYFFNSFWKFE